RGSRHCRCWRCRSLHYRRGSVRAASDPDQARDGGGSAIRSPPNAQHGSIPAWAANGREISRPRARSRPRWKIAVLSWGQDTGKNPARKRIPSERGGVAPQLASLGEMLGIEKRGPLSFAHRAARARGDLLIRGSARGAGQLELIEIAQIERVEGHRQFFTHLLQYAVGPRDEVFVTQEQRARYAAEEFTEFRVAAAEFVDIGFDGIPRIVGLAGKKTVHRMAQQNQACRPGE